MFTSDTKNKFLSTTMLVAPAALMLGFAQPALADCAVTSGGGTVANPDDGAVITCGVAGGAQTTTVGDGTDNISTIINLEENALIDVENTNAVSTDNVTITLGSGSIIKTAGDNSHALVGRANSGDITQSLTLGDDTLIQTSGSGSAGVLTGTAYGNASNVTSTVVLSGEDAQISTSGSYSTGISSSAYDGENSQTVILSGENANISTSGYGISSFSSNGENTSVVTLSGKDSNITSSGFRGDGVVSYSINGIGKSTVTLSGDGSFVRATGGALANGIQSGSPYYSNADNQATVTLNKNTSVISDLGDGIKVYSNSNSASVVDSAGLIQGGRNSVSLDEADDSLTLRTGSNLSSPNGADLGGGTDTLTLVGNGAEDEVFLNAETVDVNADDDGWTLTGTSTFDDINVNTGRFNNGGIITVNNDLTVASGARFGGAGTTIGDVVNNGIVAPGSNAIGTQNITGNFTQGAGGALNIEVDAAGNEDVLDITGAATLDGTVNFSRSGAAPLVDGTAYIVLQSTTGVTGTFATVADDFLFVDFDVQTVGNDVQATANRLSVATAARSENEEDVGRALDDIIADGGGEIDDILNALSDTKQASDLLASQSGITKNNAIASASAAMGSVSNIVRGRTNATIGTRTTGISAGDQFAQIKPAAGGDEGRLTEREFSKKSDVPYASRRRLNGYDQPATEPHQQRATPEPKPQRIASDQQHAVWIEGVGGFGSIDGDSTARGADYQTYGGAAGIETSLENGAKLGVFTAFTNTNSEVDGLRDESTVKAYQAGVYGGVDLSNKIRMNGTLSGGYLDFETDRPTVAGSANADFDGYGAFGYTELTYDLKDDDQITFMPYVALEGSVIGHEFYSESGAGVLNLDVDSETTTQLSSEIGMQASKVLSTDTYRITPTARIGWSHQFLDKSADSTANFSSAPTAVFKSEGPEQNRDSARIGLDLAISDHNNKTSLYTKYDGNLAADAQDHLFTAGVKVRW